MSSMVSAMTRRCRSSHKVGRPIGEKFCTFPNDPLQATPRRIWYPLPPFDSAQWAHKFWCISVRIGAQGA